MEITIIGLGGIGSVLANSVSRFVNNLKELTPPVINLVDGDSYEPKNKERQEFIRFGYKAEIQKLELSIKFENIIFNDYPTFINENNIKDIIKENSIIFVAVDNHAVRRLISKHSETLTDIIVISGGNELTDGNVQIFIRKGGKNLTPTLTDYHPEIENPEDTSPEFMSCEQLSNSAPQLFFTNSLVANFMCAAFYNVIIKNNFKTSEVYIDLLTMNSSSKVRAPKTNNNINI